MKLELYSATIEPTVAHPMKNETRFGDGFFRNKVPSEIDEEKIVAHAKPNNEIEQ